MNVVIENEDVIKKAVELKKANGYIDTVKLANLFGIEVVPENWKDDSSAYIKFDDSNDKFIIFVNTNHSKERQRFSIAHEIAHFILHKEIIKELKQVDRNSLRSLAPEQEKAADKLAAKILMPDNLVEEYLTQLHITKQNEINKDTLSKFAKDFNVSFLAAYIKLKELNYNLSYNI